jgi:hypothetical protein
MAKTRQRYMAIPGTQIGNAKLCFKHKVKLKQKKAH